MRKIVTSVVFGLAALGAASAHAADRVAVPVSGLKNDEGVVRCGLYDGAQAFPKAGQESRGVIARIKGERRPASLVASSPEPMRSRPSTPGRRPAPRRSRSG